MSRLIVNKSQNFLKQFAETLPEPTPKDPPVVSSPRDATEPQPVEGGLLYRTDLDAEHFQNQTKRMRQLTIVRNKRWNSTFNIFTPFEKKDVFHLFHLYFSKDNFEHNAINPERAERIKYLGVFRSKEAALEFVRGEGQAFRLPQDKSIEIAGEKPEAPAEKN